MPLLTNSYAFSADYSRVASCLSAIQIHGVGQDPTALQLISVLEGDVLKKLYTEATEILAKLKGVTVDDLKGDFEFLDFSYLSFNDGLLDTSNSGYSFRFQTVLNIFTLLQDYTVELSIADIQSLNSALIAFLEVFEALQAYLIKIGLNPCAAQQQYFNNSAGLYLQAAGADGSDGVAAGIHLRWSLAGDIGLNHIPQGAYYNQHPELVPTGYNQKDDYIIISRTPYTNTIPIVLDFETAVPAIDFQNRRWTYTINTQSTGGLLTSVFRLTFNDALKYNQAVAAASSGLDNLSFLKAYNGLLEIEIVNKNAFTLGFDFRLNESSGSANLKLQGISSIAIPDAITETICFRKTVTANSAEPVTGTIFADNIQKLELQISAGGYLQSLTFETYDDFIQTRQAADWTVVGADFGLSTDTNESGVVANRLENTAYPIDDLWPQYKDGTKTRVANYWEKWTIDRENEPGLANTVAQYLTLSVQDSRAMVSYEAEDDSLISVNLSLLDLINLTATDFHFARMLGLGCIDTAVNGQAAVSYVYKASYHNNQTTYEALSLPTDLTHNRLPTQPVMRPVTYTLPVSEQSNLFDENGYAVYGDSRAINLGRELFAYELPADNYFNTEDGMPDFDSAEAVAIFYGVEYKLAGAASYQKPDITGDLRQGYDYYAYDAGQPEGQILETIPVPDNTDSLYIHQEKQPGVHVYAIYGINWFSRASALSAEQSTDETIFPLKNTLKAPSGLTGQYIQTEDPLIFTTATEQTWLSGRQNQFPGQDTNYTRITFNWLDVTDITFEAAGSPVIKPQAVKSYFKADAPLQVAGVISYMLPVEGQDNLIRVIATQYSSVDGTAVVPSIATEDLSRFAGSLFITPEGQFKTVSVAAGPIFTIEKIVVTDVVSSDSQPDLYNTTDSYVLPRPQSRFTITENLTDASNWSPLAETVTLVDFTDPSNPDTFDIEEITDVGSETTTLMYGGIIGNASVLAATALDGTPMPGYYLVTFEGATLPPLSQVNPPFNPQAPGANNPATLQSPDVYWYNGLIRLPRQTSGSSTEKKLINVIRISQTVPIQLYVYDSSYNDDPFQLSSSTTDWISGINFHPGYKVYLFPEPTPGHTFNGANLLPPADQASKKTMIGLQTSYNGPDAAFVSEMSAPVVLLARRILEPVQPDAPIIYNLKVRPDATTKAALTFDVKVMADAGGASRYPFGFAFYRTTNEDVLRALYLDDPDATPDQITVTNILNDLNLLTEDLQFNSRYLELVNVTFDSAHPGEFRVFDAVPNPYGFPVPNKPGLLGPDDTTPEAKAVKYKQAIQGTLLPLTAQTPVYQFIKTGRQTENKLPSIRDINGNLIDQNDTTNFDPFPMVRKYSASGVDFVRFTDYSLNGSARFLYFYASAEVTEQLVIGPVSNFNGGVIVLHTLPAEAPSIRKFTLGPPAQASLSAIAVTFYLSPFFTTDPITQVRIYRTTDPAAAVSLQAMNMQLTVPVNFGTDGGIVVMDDFNDLMAVPFGEVIYYRLAFVRTIINEREASEDIVGEGSAVIKVTLIDIVNPVAPVLTYSADTLTWSPTANKATYYLYQQNSKGNWQKLDTVTPPDSAGTMSFTLVPPPASTDADGNPIYTRFKVKVENSSGLLNLVDNEYTIPIN